MPSALTYSRTAQQMNFGGAVTEETHTIKKTIGWPSAVGTDFLWTSAANTTQQNVDLGAIIPLKCKVIDIQVVCTETITGTGLTDFTAVIGNASAGAQFITALSCFTLNVVVGWILGTLLIPTIVSWTAASHVWIGGVPIGGNWNAMTAGKWCIYMTYRNYANI
jgi:hypothetical protein